MSIHQQPMPGNWHYPTAIRFGSGRISELPDACCELDIKRPLLVTDPGLNKLSLLHEAVQRCNDSGLACNVFAEVQGNPIEDNVSAGVNQFKQYECDGVIAFGGGSALDTGKAVALMVGQERPIWDFEDREDWYTRANAESIAAIVAVPTTSGTGSEVGRAAVITDTTDHVKKIIFHPKMMPARVILDPELTTGLPAHITAAVGMDALSHNLEAFCSPVYHPMAQGIALEGIRLIKQWLAAAVADGNDIDARAQLQVASSMGATAFQKGLGAMHSLSHPCSSLFNTHLGLTNAVVMPYVLQFNRSAIEQKMSALARYLDLPNPSYSAVLDWVLALREQIGIAHTLAELGVDEAEVPKMAAMAEVDPPSATNPIPVQAAAFEQLYHNCIAGKI